ncbi:MAG: hypothetical protein K0S65_6278, partial [Labilithrix sp.]|nr:hypothetical protein [Labilithrix sp.]
MNWKFGVTALLVGSVFVAAIPGCALDTDEAGEEGDAEETAATQDELTSNATKLVGAYHGAGGSLRPPTFQGLVFQQNGEFFADVDTGIRCITAPCPSNVRLSGRFTATRNYVRLAPKAGEAAHAYHGRYRYTLTSKGGLSLSRAGASWANWTNQLDKELSYCAEPTDCNGQALIHPMCVGHWTCGEQRSCGWECGVPTPANEIWPADRTQLVAESPGGGFVPPAPAGSTCTIGRQKYTLDTATRKLAWEECAYPPNGQPYHLTTGSRVVSAAELGGVDAAMNDVAITTGGICGADKPMLSIKVTSASQGPKTYTDSFYSCMG